LTQPRLEKIKRILDMRQPDLTIVMEDVHKPHNLAAIIRSCDAVGVVEVHAIANRTQIGLRKKAASGAYKWVGYKTHPTTMTAYRALREQGLNIYATDTGSDAIDYRDADFTLPCAIVVGAELEGITQTALSEADVVINIPLYGMVESLNVSVATALILFEANRQRKAAGLYDRNRLDDATYKRLLFEWLHPELTAYCKKHQLNYPELDENGDLIETFTHHLPQ
jgi:tRNA (guanosine-2'-O-)-methyltransferase